MQYHKIMCLDYGDARIGKNCRINACTNIGRASIHGGQETGAPVIGDNVYIAPGAKIFGPVGPVKISLVTFFKIGLTRGV